MRVNGGDAERSTTQTDTTCEGGITLSGFLLGHPNNTIGHKLYPTNIGQVQGLDELRQHLRSTSRTVNLGRKVHGQRARALNGSSHDRQKKAPSGRRPSLALIYREQNELGAPQKRDKKAYHKIVNSAFPGGCFPARYLAPFTKKQS